MINYLTFPLRLNFLGWAEQGGCDQSAALDASGSGLWGEKSVALSQKWSVVSKNVVLMEARGSSTQMWSPVFLEPGYALALHPGFPGTVGPSCLTSTQDLELAMSAMRSCDASMSLLIGQHTSLGTFKASVDLIVAHGAGRMSGYCCMDTAINSDFFGYSVSRCAGIGN